MISRYLFMSKNDTVEVPVLLLEFLLTSVLSFALMVPHGVLEHNAVYGLLGDLQVMHSLILMIVRMLKMLYVD